MFFENNFLKIVILMLVVVTEGNPFYNITRTRRQADCGFTCSSGECIDEDSECDGKGDCKNGSDETIQCQRLKCLGYTFQCAYGACIDNDLVCNQRNDCKDGSDEDASICKNNTITCSSDEFNCNSGECISDEKKCDGEADCADKSDETLATCGKMVCPHFSYKCDYGACVGSDAFCNHIRDCFDNSDEDPVKCNYTNTPDPDPELPPTTVSTDPCILPQYPDRGKWHLPNSISLSPGQMVSPGTLLTVSCNTMYRYEGFLPYSSCQNGKWNPTIGTCAKICKPPLHNTDTTTVKCSINGYEEDCSQPRDKTLAKFSCVPFYEILGAWATRVCKNGTWDNTAPKCSPQCGVKGGKAVPQIVNGTITERGQYPWHVALYKEGTKGKVYLCGGSIISPTAVITAAHCVTDLNTKELFPANSFIVAAGKYYSSFDSDHDKNAQISSLENIYIPRTYGGNELKYLANIALLIVKTKFTITYEVQPVCVDWNNDFYKHISSETNLKGFVPGWGKTSEGGSISVPLREVIMPYVSPSICKNELPRDFIQYFTNDKLCSGYRNQSISVCQGDSGGGLVFQNPIDNRYYLTGIVSVSPSSEDKANSCDSQQYALFTFIAEYIDFLLVAK